MVPKPIALALFLCDYVIVEERTKKISLIGNFTGVAADRFPTILPPFSIFAVLTDGIGDATIEIGVARLDTAEELFVYRSSLHFPDKLAEVPFHVRLRQCSFPSPGLYQFTLLVDGDWIAQRRIRVHLRGS
jgi:hypothetical protein